jgi:hypothetical protein
MHPLPTPLISHIEWGRIDVVSDLPGLPPEAQSASSPQRFKDAKIYPGGARAWDWGETGTRHDPGIQLADAEELLGAGADVVVLSRGMELVLQLPAGTSPSSSHARSRCTSRRPKKRFVC